MQVRRVLRFRAQLKGMSAAAPTVASTNGSPSLAEDGEKDWGAAKIDELSRHAAEGAVRRHAASRPDLVILDEPSVASIPSSQALKDIVVELGSAESP